MKGGDGRARDGERCGGRRTAGGRKREGRGGTDGGKRGRAAHLPLWLPSEELLENRNELRRRDSGGKVRFSGGEEGEGCEQGWGSATCWVRRGTSRLTSLGQACCNQAATAGLAIKRRGGMGGEEGRCMVQVEQEVREGEVRCVCVRERGGVWLRGR